MNELSIKEYAQWIREDIESTNLDQLVKDMLTTLGDEELVELIRNVEENMDEILDMNSNIFLDMNI